MERDIIIVQRKMCALLFILWLRWGHAVAIIRTMSLCHVKTVLIEHACIWWAIFFLKENDMNSLWKNNKTFSPLTNINKSTIQLKSWNIYCHALSATETIIKYFRKHHFWMHLSFISYLWYSKYFEGQSNSITLIYIKSHIINS